jgi:PBP1b-binding outer membrane lipoprotein LpoB
MKNKSVRVVFFASFGLAAILFAFGCAQKQAQQPEVQIQQPSASTPSTMPDFAFIAKLKSMPQDKRQAFIQQNQAQVAQLSNDNNQTLQIEYSYLVGGK